MQRGYILGLIILILTITIGYTISSYYAAPPTVQQAPVSTLGTAQGTVPEFSFHDMSGGAHNIRDYQGKIILLNFWASWCAPCIKEFPALIRTAGQYKDNVVLIALSADFKIEAMEKFLNSLHADKTLDLDTGNIITGQDVNQSIMQDLFGTYALPETYIIAPDQRLHTKLVGANWTEAELHESIESLIGAAQP